MPGVGGRALVLGGGGITGIAWELGLLAGLGERGLDLSGADLVVGTSAGSSVAAQITSGEPLEALYERQLAPPAGERAARLSPLVLARFGFAFLRHRTDPRAARAAVGRFALETRTVSEDERLRVIASRLPRTEWPDRRLLITAVDARTGEERIFDRDAGASLVEAVAASCAVPGVWPPVTIGGRRYVDGGVRSSTNADLAAGAERVVVLAPISRGGGPMPAPATQLRELARRGARTVLITPDREALRAIGRNVLDPSRRAPSARAGRAQAGAVAAEVSRVWR